MLEAQEAAKTSVDFMNNEITLPVRQAMASRGGAQ